MPLSTTSQWWPQPSASALIRIWLTLLSSAASRRKGGKEVPVAAPGASPVPGLAAAAAAPGAVASTRCTVKQLPWPGVLSTPMLPPIRATISRQMASPRPVPP